MDVYRVIKTVRHRPIRLNGEVAALEFLPGVKAVYGITQSATQLGFSPGKAARIRLGRTPMGQAVRVYGFQPRRRREDPAWADSQRDPEAGRLTSVRYTDTHVTS